MYFVHLAPGVVVNPEHVSAVITIDKKVKGSWEIFKNVVIILDSGEKLELNNITHTEVMCKLAPIGA